MSFENLNIIGERINPGFKTTKRLFDEKDIDGIKVVAKDLVQNGASGININIGETALEESDFMIEVVRAVQDVAAVPLSFDYPDVELQKLCLAAYDEERAGGKPIINSISECRLEMLELLDVRPSRIVVMASEKEVAGIRTANKTGSEVHETARRMVARILQAAPTMTSSDIIIDVSIGPIAADMEGLTRMAVEAIELIGSDPNLSGVHMMVGLTNLSVMLPKNAVDGSLLKPQIESAFLTLTVPKGLDMILGTPGRDYRVLPDDNMVLQSVKEVLNLEGLDAVRSLKKLYKTRRR